MTHEPAAERAPEDQDDQDRAVSRRVDNPTDAEPGDDSAYRAANSVPDGDDAATSTAERGGTPGASSTEAAEEMDDENESEPGRSE